MFLSDLPDSAKPPAKQPLMSRRIYTRFLRRLQSLPTQAKANHQATQLQDIASNRSLQLTAPRYCVASGLFQHLGIQALPFCKLSQDSKTLLISASIVHDILKRDRHYLLHFARYVG